MSVKYRKGFKYQLAEDEFYDTGMTGQSGQNRFCKLSDNGFLFVYAGYAWDGPSGPTFDTDNFMRASLIHDTLYQMMREGLLPQEYRDEADEIMRKICLEDGMSELRAGYVFAAVRMFAEDAADPENLKPILETP